MVKTGRTKEKTVTSKKKKTVRQVETTETDIVDVAEMPVERRRFLYVMRHAKASKDFETFTDIERPLAKRGKKDAKMMKKFMKKMGMKPQICLVSPSVRTRETLDILRDAFPNANMRFSDTIFDAESDVLSLLELIRALPEECEEVLLLGHLPSVPNLVRFLANEGISDEDGLMQMGKKFPTAALAVLELNPSVAWHDLDENSCRLSAFVRPKDLR